MIKYCDITKRQIQLEYMSNKNNINFNFLKKQMSNALSVSLAESYLQAIDSSLLKNSNMVLEMVNTVEQFINTHSNTSENKKIISFLSENTIFRVPDMKNNKSIFTDFIERNSKYDMSLLKESINIIIGADRVINNNNRLDKYCNFNKLIKENYTYNESIENVIYEACRAIDKLDMKDSTKLNVALENILYSLNKNNIKVNKDAILELATTYFFSSDRDINSMIKIIRLNEMYNNDDKKDFKFIIDPIIINCEESTQKIIDEATKRESILEVLNKFKLSKEQKPEVLKKLIKSFYAKSKNNIVNDTPNFLSWIRKFTIFSTVAINPYLGIIGLFIDECISMGIKRGETNKILNSLKAEKKKAESGLKSAKKEDTKKKYKELIKTLDSNIEKVEIYNDSLYSDKELMEKDDINECFKSLSYFVAISEEINKYNNINIYELLENNIDKLDYTVLYEVNKLLSNSFILDGERIKNIYEEYRDRNSNNINTVSILNEGIYNIKKNMLSLKQCDVLNEYINYNNSIELIEEAVKGVNTLKLTLERLRKNTQKLSDKEKMMSKQMDNAVDRMYRKMQLELTNKNREAVIKGTILPSLSSILKLAMTSGAAYLINPALSVITFVGGLAISKQATKKEKQYILDEIDIQLKVVEKKIQLAESNSDMKSLEQLMKIEKQLKRERQRIMYNKKNYYSTEND